jgi:hypothetical protein
MRLRGAVATSAIELLASLVGSQWITIMVPDTSEDFSARLATLKLDGYEMTLKHMSAAHATYVNLRRTTSSDW